MPLEPATFIGELNPANPTGADPKSDGDDHIRMLKDSILNSLVGVASVSTDGGAANAYTITPANPLPEYRVRMLVMFSPTAANTGASTLNISGLGAKQLVSVSGAALAAGDLTAGCIYVAVYDGTRFRLVSVTKNYIDQLAFESALPTAPGDAEPYDLVSIAGSALWQPRTAIFDDVDKLAQAQAIALSF